MSKEITHVNLTLKNYICTTEGLVRQREARYLGKEAGNKLITYSP